MIGVNRETARVAQITRKRELTKKAMAMHQGIPPMSEGA